MKKNIIFILLITIVMSLLCACQGFEQTIDQPELKYSTQYPQTVEEYNLAMNKEIVPFLNYLETHITSGRNILDGKYPIANELKSIDNDLKLMEETYAKCEKIYPPTSMASTHASVLLQMKEAINSISVYQEYMQKTGDTISDPTIRSDIQKTIDIMINEFNSLRGVFNIA